MSIVVLYHAQCTDGAAAMWAAWKKFGDNASYIPIGKSSKKQSNILDKCKSASEIYMCDIMLDKEEILEILNSKVKIYFLDHHITNIQNIFGRRALGIYKKDVMPMLMNYDWKTGNCIFDVADSNGNKNGHIPHNDDFWKTSAELQWYYPDLVFEHNDLNKSGAGIVWDFFHDTPRPIIIDLVEEFDLGHWVDDCETVHCYLSQFNWNNKNNIIDIFEKLSVLNLDDLKKLGEPVYEYKKNLIQKSIGQIGRAKITINETIYDVPCLNTDHFTSELGYHMYSKKDEPFAFVWRVQNDGSVRVSLRSSDKGEDVSIIAQNLGNGGGGHIRASGTTFKSMYDMLKVIKFYE